MVISLHAGVSGIWGEGGVSSIGGRPAGQILKDQLFISTICICSREAATFVWQDNHATRTIIGHAVREHCVEINIYIDFHDHAIRRESFDEVHIFTCIRLRPFAEVPLRNHAKDDRLAVQGDTNTDQKLTDMHAAVVHMAKRHYIARPR